MNNVLVTGASGFIGYNFVRKYHKAFNIIALDSLTYASNKDSIEFFKKEGIKFLKMNINDLTTQHIKENNIDTIINFAAESHVDNSIKSPGIFIESNINGVFNILEIVRETKVRFHQISTDEVYGDLPLEDTSLKFTTTSNIKPSSPYSASKAAADHLVMSYVRTFGIRATISRCSNNYGEYQNDEKLIPTIIRNILKGKKVGIYGDGKNVRDWIYVEDHNDAVVHIIENTEKGIFNIGSENEMSNIKLTRKIIEIIGANEDVIEFIEDRQGHDRRYAIDPKSMADLGWKSKYSFNDGIKKTITFYKKHYS